MSYDYAKRGCSLPTGCKDLIDVSKYLVHEGNKVLIDLPEASLARAVKQRVQSATELIGEVAIDWQASISEFAALIGKHPSRIIVDLLRVGVYCSAETRLGFWALRKIARDYGYEVKLKSPA